MSDDHLTSLANKQDTWSDNDQFNRFYLLIEEEYKKLAKSIEQKYNMTVSTMHNQAMLKLLKRQKKSNPPQFPNRKFFYSYVHRVMVNLAKRRAKTLLKMENTSPIPEDFNANITAKLNEFYPFNEENERAYLVHVGTEVLNAKELEAFQLMLDGKQWNEIEAELNGGRRMPKMRGTIQAKIKLELGLPQ